MSPVGKILNTTGKIIKSMLPEDDVEASPDPEKPAVFVVGPLIPAYIHDVRRGSDSEPVLQITGATMNYIKMLANSGRNVIVYTRAHSDFGELTRESLEPLKNVELHMELDDRFCPVATIHLSENGKITGYKVEVQKGVIPIPATEHSELQAYDRQNVFTLLQKRIDQIGILYHGTFLIRDRDTLNCLHHMRNFAAKNGVPTQFDFNPRNHDYSPDHLIEGIMGASILQMNFNKDAKMIAEALNIECETPESFSEALFRELSAENKKSLLAELNKDVRAEVRFPFPNLEVCILTDGARGIYVQAKNGWSVKQERIDTLTQVGYLGAGGCTAGQYAIELLTDSNRRRETDHSHLFSSHEKFEEAVRKSCIAGAIACAELTPVHNIIQSRVTHEYDKYLALEAKKARAPIPNADSLIADDLTIQRDPRLDQSAGNP